MIARDSGARAHHDAPALRFLSLCAAGWVAIRILASWSAAAPAAPVVPARAWASQASVVSAPLRTATMAAAASAAAPLSEKSTRAPAARRAGTGEAAAPGGGNLDRYALRLALMTRLLAPGIARRSTGALAPSGGVWRAPTDAVRAVPGGGAPYWMHRDLSGWSASGWAFVRAGSDAAPDAIAAAGQIGGSQAGLRIAYGLGRDGRLRAYGRATMALDRPQQREIAAGIAFAPLPALPVDIAVEQRIAAGSEGRSALAVMAFGGVGDVALPAGFRLEAYAQAGVVGGHRLDGFADGAVVIDHRLGSDPSLPLSVGALAAGAVQPGAERLDVGPRLTLQLPDVGQGSRIAIDWRQRVAGDALPDSGVAVTLAADF